MNPPVTLAISIVCYQPSPALLQATLDSLSTAIAQAKQDGRLAQAHLFLIDNDPIPTGTIAGLMQAVAAVFDSVELIAGQGNVGYGRGHNLAINAQRAEYHLVLNPDVRLAADSLSEALLFCATHPELGLLTPQATDGNGNKQYLCKRYPSVLDLLLRGFAPAAVKTLFRQRLAAYEMRDLDAGQVVWDVPIVSGCFMLFRTAALTAVGGFAPRYFLYFEDFDLSLRLAQRARIAYVPQVRITHYGGHAARKGWRHIRLFAHSALLFFRSHGWRWC